MLEDHRPRPAGLMVIAVLNIIQGAWLLALGSMFAGIAVIGLFSLEPGAVGGFSVLYGVLVAGVGLVHMAVAYALYAFRSWAWLGAMLISAASLVVSLGAYAFTSEAPTLVSLLIPLVCIVYLLRPSIRGSFAS